MPPCLRKGGPVWSERCLCSVRISIRRYLAASTSRKYGLNFSPTIIFLCTLACLPMSYSTRISPDLPLCVSVESMGAFLQSLGKCKAQINESHALRLLKSQRVFCLLPVQNLQIIPVNIGFSGPIGVLSNIFKINKFVWVFSDESSADKGIYNI